LRANRVRLGDPRVMPILLDFESRSRADLKTIGGRNYWAHPSTQALCCVLYDTDTGEAGAWTEGDPCPVSPDDQLAAHNAMGFDRFGAERLGWRSASDPTWIDTSELARRAGLPGALDALGARWLGLRKDKEASKFTKGLSRPSRAKKTLGQLPELTSDGIQRVIGYCASDVEILAHGWPLLSQWLDAGWENDVSRVDRIVNDRGIAFDRQLARRLLEEDARNAEMACEAGARELGAGWTAALVRAAANSPQQFAALARTADATAETIERILHDGGRTYPREAYVLAGVRRAIASIARGKLEAGLARVSPDGRLRDMHRYIGAHTWRWSGRGMQLQNIPRPT
jgi:DNA polymerase